MKSRDDLSDYQIKARMALAILLTCLLLFTGFAIIAGINLFVWELKWIDVTFEWSSIFLNIVALWFCVYQWRLYYRDSIESEKQAQLRREELEAKYDDAKDWSYFNHKEARRQVGLMYGLAVVVNVFFLGVHFFW